MELNKERGPIYSRYDRDQSANYSAVVDYAAPPRTSEEIAFIIAHKITPNQADPGDMQTGTNNRYQQAEAPLPAFLQLLSNSMGQRTPSQGASLQGRTSSQVSWAGRHGNTRQTEAQKRVALVGVIIWVVFILAAMLMSLFGR
ncbi:MAG: hypothetical protein NTX94_00645 [Caldiserica bacterium]|nr:hypothetical protein [Caldisericota bacterium]